MKNHKNKIFVTFTVAITLFILAFSAVAQNTEFGLRFMPTFSSFNMKTSTGGNIKGEITLGYGVGALLGFNLTQHTGIQGEIIYNTLSQQYKEQDVERKINLKYINIPFLLSINSGKNNPVNLNLVVGPQIGISVGTNVTTSGGDGVNTSPAILSVKKGDLGFAYGAGLDFALNTSRTVRLGLGFRGVYGLLDISNNSTTATTDSYYILDRTFIKTYSVYTGLSILF
jgi:opacity protein-like surface antigen